MSGTAEKSCALNAAVQAVFGTAGLIETVVQFTYVLINRESFTTFEEWFFLMSGCSEVTGEILFLLAGLGLFAFEADPRKRSTGLRSLSKDPIHCLVASSYEAASGKVNEALEDYGRWSFIGVLISTLSMLVWASFWAVWGKSFDGDGDARVRWALSLCAVGSAVVFLTCWLWKKDESYYMLTAVVLIYASGKAFQVFILVSDLDRLSPSDLGVSLIFLQIIEVVSVAFVLGSILVRELRRVPSGAVGPRNVY